jgi:D-sedoheptulose 7-phosphate isomerase
LSKFISSAHPFISYSENLQKLLFGFDWSRVEPLALDLSKSRKEKRQVFICGNGGSAANAIHLANDFLYGVTRTTGEGIRAQALSANAAVITCLANDIGYESIFSEQLAVQGVEGDLLIALSGSGNSPNIVCAINQAKKMGIKTYAILGFDGGICKKMADVALHFQIDDMQIAEDMQLIVGHMLMKWLYTSYQSEKL